MKEISVPLKFNKNIDIATNWAKIIPCSGTDKI